MEGWLLENRRQKNLKKYKFYFLKLIFLGGLVAGKSVAKKTEEKYMFYFFKTYIFGRAGRGKTSGKKTEKKIFFGLNLYFLEGWLLENRRQKNVKNIKVLFF